MDTYGRLQKEVVYLCGMIGRLEQEVQERKRQKRSLEKVLKRFSPAIQVKN
jgi:hypothetical protein